MPNPMMNDKAVDQAAGSAGWGAPAVAGRSTVIPGTPIDDGPISGWQSGLMTIRGTMTAGAVLLILLLGSASFGWASAPDSARGTSGFPGMALVAMVVGFGCAIAVHFKPMMAKVLGPIYALAQGFFLGVISKAFNVDYEGIVVQAVGATLAVFAVMLFLYQSRIIKVTDRFRRIVIMATMGLMAFYLISIVINLVGGSVPFLQSASPLGILFSVFAAGLAAMMLAVNFDTIERGAKAGWPKGMEWYCAFGLLATLVWLYLEILQLLAKLNRR